MSHIFYASPSIIIAKQYDSFMLALSVLRIGNCKYGINSRNAKNANYGKKANSSEKAKN